MYKIDISLFVKKHIKCDFYETVHLFSEKMWLMVDKIRLLSDLVQMIRLYKEKRELMENIHFKT